MSGAVPVAKMKARLTLRKMREMVALDSILLISARLRLHSGNGTARSELEAGVSAPNRLP